jgi:hypothetical protein
VRPSPQAETAHDAEKNGSLKSGARGAVTKGNGCVRGTGAGMRDPCGSEGEAGARLKTWAESDAAGPVMVRSFFFLFFLFASFPIQNSNHLLSLNSNFFVTNIISH